MAVAFDAKSTGQGSAVSSVSFTHTPVGTPSAVAIGCGGFTGTATPGAQTCTYGGTSAPQAFTLANSPSNADAGIIFGLASPPSGAQTVVVSSAGNTFYPIAMVASVTGSDTTTCFDGAVAATGTSTSLAATVTGGGTGDLVFFVGFQDGHPFDTFTNTTSGATNIYTTTVNGGETQACAYVAGGSSVTTTYTYSTSANWIMMAASFKVAGSGGVTGTLATTETADAASISGSVADTGTLAATETADTAALAGSVFIGGTLAATEAADALSFSGNVGVSGPLAATDAQDSASLSGNTGASGSLAATETADSAALAGAVFDGGLLVATETADSLSFSGSIGVSGPFVATDSPDSASFAGAFIVTGTFAAAESPDVLAFTSSPVVTGTFSTTEYADAAAFVLTAFPPNYNPLERLKMYTGTLGAVSNREDWIVNISFIDTDGNALDISTAQSIVTYVCRQGCPNSPVLSASLSDKIIITDNYTLQWAFAETDMQSLCASQYDVFCRVEMNDIWTQILSANVAIVEGGPQ